MSYSFQENFWLPGAMQIELKMLWVSQVFSEKEKNLFWEAPSVLVPSQLELEVLELSLFSSYKKLYQQKGQHTDCQTPVSVWPRLTVFFLGHGGRTSWASCLWGSANDPNLFCWLSNIILVFTISCMPFSSTLRIVKLHLNIKTNNTRRNTRTNERTGYVTRHRRYRSIPKLAV